MNVAKFVTHFIALIMVLGNVHLTMAEGSWLTEKQGGSLWWYDVEPQWLAAWTGSYDAESRIDGAGTLTFFKNDQTVLAFAGTFKQGLAEGFGKAIWQNGSVYEGNWVAGERNGQGIMKWKSGNHYEGNWKDGKMHGKGTYYFASGDIYRGEFQEGSFSGIGTYKWKDGEYYQGHFADDKFNGYGEKHFWDGSVLGGLWENDSFMKFTGENSGTPLAKLDFWVERKYGVPVACLKVKNVSEKTIDAFKVNVSCYNSYGEGVYSLGTNVFRGIAQSTTIQSGETYTFRWNLFGYSTTTKISASIRSVHFLDGGTWTP